jgi:nicotinate-nucleotide adenylyltransferase
MTGLFFGTFNPIHVGHLILAQHLYYHQDLEAVWFVVSPQNPFKQKHNVINKYERLYMVNLAIEDCPYFKSSDLEFSLPLPSFTWDSLQAFKNQFPDKEFALIVGSDSLQNMHRWKNGGDILEKENILVYPRPGHPPAAYFFEKENITIADAPLVDVSSTLIRESIRNNKPQHFFLSDKVWRHIDRQLIYK